MKLKIAGGWAAAIMLVACGVDEEKGSEVGVSREPLISFTATGSPWNVDVVGASSSASGPYLYGRHNVSGTLWATDKQSIGPWSAFGWVTEAFTGVPHAAATSDNCDAVFVRKSSGQVGLAMLEQISGFGCGSTSASFAVVPFAVVPGAPTLTGSPVASSSFSGLTHRFDVFVRDSAGNIVSATGTGPKSSLTWSSTTTDYGISIQGDPAVVASGSRIDLVACDVNGNLRHKIYSGGAWGSWSAGVGGSGCFLSPSVVAQTTKHGYTQLTVVSRTSLLDYQTVSYLSGGFGAGWGTWSLLGGVWTSAPALHLRTGGKRIWGHNVGSGVMFGDF